MNPGFNNANRFFLCVLSAILVCFSFPNFISKTLTPPTAFLAWLALIPFFLALRGATPKQGAILGWIFGFVQFGGILYWIALLQAAQNLSGLAWAALVLYLSLYFLVFGWLYCFLAARFRWGEWIAPCLWVSLEYIRGSRPWGGFSWGEIGYSQAAYPSVLAFTTWGGVYGLTFLIVWFNASLARFLSEGFGFRGIKVTLTSRSVWRNLVLPFGVLLIVLAFGFLEIRGTALRKAGTVALLQPSIDQDVKWSKEYTGITFDTLGHLVDSLKDFKTDLVVWPETAAPSYLLSTAADLQRVVKIIRKSKTTHLVGCLDNLWDSRQKCYYYNAAISFNSMGKPLGIYHKRHRVPFGEFVPFQKYISFLGPVVGDLGNFDAGTGYEKFQARGFSYTPMICYEVIFPGDVFQAFQTKAEALVNISNDAWYGRTASAYQHAMMAVVRAAEEHKPLLRAANTGICLATDPFGRILAHTQLFEETCLTADVVMTSTPEPTLYSLWGNWFPHLCWVLTGLMVFWAWLRPRSLTHPNLEDSNTPSARS